METREILHPVNAGSKRKVDEVDEVDKGEHRQPLILVIATSAMISDDGIME